MSTNCTYMKNYDIKVLDLNTLSCTHTEKSHHKHYLAKKLEISSKRWIYAFQSWIIDQFYTIQAHFMVGLGGWEKVYCIGSAYS